jgi:hypothetical protein
MEIYAAAGGLVSLAFGAWIAREVFSHYKPVSGPVRFPNMVQRLGMSVDEIIASDLAYHVPTAQRVCQHCDQVSECDRLLCSGKALDEAPRFCPNAAYLNLARHPSGAVD